MPDVDGYELLKRVRALGEAERRQAAGHRAHRLRALRGPHARAARRLSRPRREAGRAVRARRHRRHRCRSRRRFGLGRSASAERRSTPGEAYMFDVPKHRSVNARPGIQGLSAPRAAVCDRRYRPPGLERDARRSSISGRGLEGVGARAQPRMDGRLHARNRRAPCPARQDDDGATAFRAADRGRGVGHHVRDDAAGEPRRCGRVAADHPRQPAHRPRGHRAGEASRREYAGARALRPARFAGRTRADRKRWRAARSGAAVKRAPRSGARGRPHRLPDGR